jgi:hypothetical protein
MHLHERRLGVIVALAVLGTLGVYIIDSQGLYGLNVNVDILAHFAGGIAVGAGVYVAVHRVLDLSQFYSDVAALGATVVAAFAVEVFEVVSPTHAGYVALGAQDTQGDILAVIVGGFVAIMVARRYRSGDGSHSH